MRVNEALTRAVDATEIVVRGVRPAELGLTTPCPTWDVRALLSHMVGTLWLFDGAFRDATPRCSMNPGDLPAADVLGASPAAAYREAADALLAAAVTPGAIEHPHQTIQGEIAGETLAGFATLELLVHGWDLACATGKRAPFESDLVEHVLRFASRAITDETRGTGAAPAVTVDAAAPPIQRLAAFLGRTP